jgi:hypothetical protein
METLAEMPFDKKLLKGREMTKEIQNNFMKRQTGWMGAPS